MLRHFAVVMLLTVAVWATEIPCVVMQVDNSLFPSEGKVAVHAVSSRTGNCPQGAVVEFNNGAVRSVADTIRYTVSRKTANGYEMVGELRIARVPSGGEKRVELPELTLADGSYILNSLSGDNFLEAVHFTVGGVGEGPADLDVAYIQAERAVGAGYLYFRCHLGNRGLGSGYLYQVRRETTEILPVEFELVDPQDRNILVNQSFVRGGTLDLAWVRVKLSNNLLNPQRPVHVAINIDGVTVQGVAYDPTKPSGFYLGGFGGETSPR